MDEVPEMEYESNLKKSIVLNIEGTLIGIIGYLTPDTKFLAPRNKLVYEDEIIAIKREVESLRQQNVKIIIALGHSGFLKDLEIAEHVDGLDLVIGGHSNTFLTNINSTNEKPEFFQGLYPTMVKQLSGKKVPVVQAYAYTKYLGKLSIIFDNNGNIKNITGEPLLLDNKIVEDPETKVLVDKYHKKVAVINEKVVGTSATLLDNTYCRLEECNIGNLITDSLVDYLQTSTDEKYCVDIAVVQGGRIRTSIDRAKKPFNMTKGDWQAVLPFTDSLTLVSMNGSILLNALEHSVDTWRLIDSTGQFLQLSGVSITYDLAKPPGARIKEAKVASCDNPEQKEINPESIYHVVMPLFLAEGGDGYEMFASQKTHILALLDLTCVINYLSKHKLVNPQIEGRIQVLNKDAINILEYKRNTKNSGQLLSTSLFVVMILLSSAVTTYL